MRRLAMFLALALCCVGLNAFADQTIHPEDYDAAHNCSGTNPSGPADWTPCWQDAINAARSLQCMGGSSNGSACLSSADCIGGGECVPPGDTHFGTIEGKSG